MLRHALKRLRHAQRQFSKSKTYENAVELQNAKWNFEFTKRETIRRI